MSAGWKVTTEFELIERIRVRARAVGGVVVGIGDDAAVLAPTLNHELVVTTDVQVPGRHFTDDWSAEEIGHLAAHANLSDLAAMAARPRWALLALTLPAVDLDWVDGFLDGFLPALEGSGAILVGGNLTRGPLNIAVQLLGDVPAGKAVRREGAQPGDLIVVTGTLGDAAAALELGAQAPAELVQRLRRPEARLQAGQALREQARAMIDLSDGLLADLGHLLGPGLSAQVDLDALPTSAALLEAIPDPAWRWVLQTGGGSDYELLCTLAPETDLGALAEACGVPLSVIGTLTEGQGIHCHARTAPVPERLGQGWDHFRNDD